METEQLRELHREQLLRRPRLVRLQFRHFLERESGMMNSLSMDSARREKERPTNRRPGKHQAM